MVSAVRQRQDRRQVLNLRHAKPPIVGGACVEAAPAIKSAEPFRAHYCRRSLDDQQAVQQVIPLT